MINKKQVIQAITTLKLAQEETLQEMSRCGANGGAGRVNSYAPIYNNQCQAIANLEVELASLEEAEKLTAKKPASK